MLKAVIKHSSDADKIRHRTLSPEHVSAWSTKLAEIKEEIGEVLKEEKEEKAIRQAEMELKKGENMIEHEKEIFSRPARTWFQSEKDKLNARGMGPLRSSSEIASRKLFTGISKRQYEADAGVASSKKKGKEVADEQKVRVRVIRNKRMLS